MEQMEAAAFTPTRRGPRRLLGLTLREINQRMRQVEASTSKAVGYSLRSLEFPITLPAGQEVVSTTTETSPSLKTLGCTRTRLPGQGQLPQLLVRQFIIRAT